MLAMQYSIALPADYDMGIVRERVATRGAAFDAWPGLAFKAFLISERAAGATTNRYAPFYVWLGAPDAGVDAALDGAGGGPARGASPDGRLDFLLGDGFHALASDFGRPLIEHWLPLRLQRGPRSGDVPRAATRTVLPIDDPDLRALRLREEARLDALQAAADPRGLVAATTAFDPYRWQLVRFELWAEPQPDQTPADPAETRYEVLHCSRPGL